MLIALSVGARGDIMAYQYTDCRIVTDDWGVSLGLGGSNSSDQSDLWVLIGKPANSELIKYSDITVKALDQNGAPIHTSLTNPSQKIVGEAGGSLGMTANALYSFKFEPNQQLSKITVIWKGRSFAFDKKDFHQSK
jgi:hypothetical protein